MFLAQLKNPKTRWFSQFFEDKRKMNIMAFLVDITSHLNDLNLKLQGKNNSVCDLVAAVQSFQRKLDIFKEDLKEDCTHFPSLKKISERDASSYVEFIQKLIGNFRERFVNFSLGDQLLLFIQNPFLIKNVIAFSQEAKQVYKRADVGLLQMELVDLQANVALKEQCGGCDPATFWIQTVPETMFPGLRKMALHTLSMFGSTYRVTILNT